MSKKEINNQDDQKSISEDNLSIKDDMHLFSFSLLKSNPKITVSQCNHFKLDFSKENSELNDINKTKSSNVVNNRIISLIDGDNNSSLKTLNIDVPSLDKLSQETFRNELMNEYENSFANFCGINRDQFTDLYINNKYIPILDELGDINISIKHIVDLLKTYSKSYKVRRKIMKYQRFKKYFKTQKKKIIEKKKKKLMFEVLKNNKNKEIKTIINKTNDLKKENQISPLVTIKKNINTIKNKLIQNKGNISIPDNKFLNQKFQINKLSGIINNKSSLGYIPKSNLNINNNNLSNEANKKQILNNINNNRTSFGLGYSTIKPIQEGKQNIISPNKNNFFNFSNLKSTNSNNINTNILSSININYNNQLISPLNIPTLSPGFIFKDFSPLPVLSKTPTPKILSPNNNNNIIQDRFTFNNTNGNSFFFGSNK